MSRIGVAFDGRAPIDVFLAQARAAEQAGAASLWIASHLFLRDPFSQAALALVETSRARACLMAVSPFTVHPVQGAMAAATLAERFPGRVVLCYGSGAPADLAAAGIDADRPLRALREAIEVTRALLDGERVTYAGERFRVTGRALGGGARAVPIFLAASGARVLALAGEVADGVVVSAASSTAFVRWAMTQVDHGAKGRRLERAGLVYAAVSGTPARFRRTLAMTLRGAHHRLNLELAGSQVDQAALARAVAAEDWATAEALVTDEIVQHHAVTGTAAAVQAGLAAYRAAGLDEVVLAATRDANETTAIVTAACAVGETR